MKNQNTFFLYALGFLLSVVAINAFGGGIYGLLGAKDLPIEWLRKTVFHDYTIPSLILLIMVGGSSLFAAVNVFKKNRRAAISSMAAAVILIGWLVVQLLMIGFVSFLQPLMLSVGVLIIFLNKQAYA